MNEKIQKLKISQEKKDIIEANQDMLLAFALREAYSKSKVLEENTDVFDKQFIKKMIKKMREDDVYKNYTDKQLKERIKKTYKVMKENKIKEIVDERIRYLTSTDHIIDVEL